MKHKHQMSLIARRAQIRRAAASRKDLPAVQPTGRPALRLVSTSSEAERVARADRRDLTSAVE
ncbi:hypothetical protein [Bosea beijingensis]|uniref:hypothetical protein n=1 Tax=Bosea beijingensis TaxID=3068632 RepID=UPI002740BD53|nr:hypothetical protein [Bosea sp. REN20]